MTIEEARNRVRLIIDKEDTAYLSNTEIDGFVEMGVDEFVQQYYMGFETSQDNRDKLQKIVESEEIDSQESPQLDLSSLSVAYGRLLSLSFTLAPFTNIKIIQLADLSSYTHDPFNKWSEEYPIAYVQKNHIYFKGWEGTKSVLVKYLKNTSNITDLSLHTHEEVCQISARKVLATLGDPRYQMIQSELTERRV